MQSKLFVFVGLTSKGSAVGIEVLEEKLKTKVFQNDIIITFKRKDRLLSARYDDTSYYLTLVEDKNEIKDYYEMARNYELKYDKRPVSGSELVKRYSVLRNSSSNLYKDIHYNIALEIFEEMASLDNLTIYVFQ